MKKLLILLAFSSLVNAESLPGQEVIPDYMKDGVITVTLKDGNVYTYSTNSHKVVTRSSSKKVEPKLEQTVVVKEASKKNRVTLHSGQGFKGFNAQTNGSVVKLQEQRVMVFGLSYSRMLDNQLSGSVSAFSNGTVTFGLGVDY